jgi:hypothetical protein
VTRPLSTSGQHESAPSTVAAVVARMQSLVDSLPRRDGISCFVRLYLAVTEGVQALRGVEFAAPQFTMRLDVVFADLFFGALNAYEQDRVSTPSAWVPLLESRSRRGIAPLQFALAGMNAHINRDLPVALVTTAASSTRARRGLAAARRLRADQFRARHRRGENGAAVPHRLASQDRASAAWLHHLDDVAAMWDVARARNAAWANAQAMWALRNDAGLAADYLTTLDRMVGFAGRGLLSRG